MTIKTTSWSQVHMGEQDDIARKLEELETRRKQLKLRCEDSARTLQEIENKLDEISLEYDQRVKTIQDQTDTKLESGHNILDNGP